MIEESNVEHAPPSNNGRLDARYRDLLISLFLIAVGSAAYWNSLEGAFLYDDIPAISENESIRRLWPLTLALSAPPNSPVSGRPVVSLTLALNYAWGGLEVRGYHLFNIAIHLLCALTLFPIIRRTLLSDRLRGRFGPVAPWLAFTSTVLWLLHPLQTEAVNYITQRSESLMALFYLLTLYFVVRGIRSTQASWWYGGAVLTCALGMATKEVMVTAPVMVLLYDSVFGAGSIRRALRNRWSLYGGLAATWVVLGALMMTGPRAASVGFHHSVSTAQYAANQAVLILHYLRLTVWPHPLLVDYGVPQAVTLGKAALPAAVVLALIAATIVAYRRWPTLGFLGAWVFLILSPTSSFVPIVTEVGAERRMYLPMAGLVVLAVTAAHALLEHLARRGYPRRELSWIAVGVSVAVAGVLAGATVRRNQDYREPVSMWQSVVDRMPENPRAHGNLGEALHGERRIDEAILHYRRSLELDPERAIVHYNLGNALREQGEKNAAIRHYRESVRIDPDYAPAHNNLANELQLRGELDAAVAHYLRALEIKPDNALAHYNLGEALRAQGKLDAALSHYQEVAKTDPGYRPFALASIAMILATHPNPEVRDVDQAIEVSKRAAELTGYRNPAILVSLATAYAVGGRPDDAQQIGRQALQLAVAAGNEPLVRMIRSRLGAAQEPASRPPERSSPTVEPSS